MTHRGCLVTAVLITLLAVSVIVDAEVLRWVDDDGRVHFGDRPPPGVDAEAVEVKINTYETPSIEGLAAVVSPSNDVVMYATAWCGVCKRARRYFETNNIPYKEYDIEKSRKAKREFDKLGGRGVPVIVVGKQRLNGFSAKTFQQIYDTS